MPLLKDVVPQELHDRPYLKDLLDKEQNPETFGAVFKKLDGAETLIGKRQGVLPAKDAAPEEWDKFLGQLRPEKSDAYEIPVEKDVKADEAFMKVVKESFHAGDMSPRQAQKFLAKFQPALKEYAAKQSEAQKAAQVKADSEFETLAKAALGEQNKAVMARVNAAIKEFAPAAVKPYIDKLDNNQLVIMAGVIDAIQRKYMSEDELNPKGGDAGETKQSAREKARSLNEEISKMNPMDPTMDDKRAKLRALYKEAAGA